MTPEQKSAQSRASRAQTKIVLRRFGIVAVLAIIIALSTIAGLCSASAQGPKPTQENDGTVPVIAEQIRKWLKDPDSLVFEKWSEVKLGQSPGGNPAWLVSVTYRAKNSYGAYTGNKRENYWFKDGKPQLDFRAWPR